MCGTMGDTFGKARPGNVYATAYALGEARECEGPHKAAPGRADSPGTAAIGWQAPGHGAGAWRKLSGADKLNCLCCHLRTGEVIE